MIIIIMHYSYGGEVTLINMAQATNVCNNSLSREEKNDLVLAMGSVGLFSATTCVFATIVTMVLRLHRLFAYRLALYQVLASMLYSVSMGMVLFQYNYDSEKTFFFATCQVTACVIQYCMWMKLLFTNWLTFHLFSYAVFFKNLKRLEWLYILSSLLVPLLVASIPFTTGSYGIVGPGAWCYIRNWKGDCADEKYTVGIVEQFALFYGPIMLCLVVNSVCVSIMAFVMIRRAYLKASHEYQSLIAAERDRKKQALKQLLPLLAYPFIYFMLLSLPMVHRISDAISPYSTYSLVMVHVVTGSLMGFFAGLTLVVHIAIMKFHYKKPVPSSSSVGKALGTESRTESRKQPIFDMLSTDSVTHFTPAHEIVSDQ